MELMRVLAAAMGQPWAIHKPVGDALWAILSRRALGMRLPEEDVQAVVAGRAAHVSASTAPTAIAVIPVMGVIAHRAALVTGVSQPRGTGTDALTDEFRQALRDPQVGAIVLDVDSPGGGVFGVPELAREIRDARGKKPIVAVANALAASAAYWIASAADEMVVTPSGEVGSIGVYAMHEDWSKAMERQGVAATFVHAGRFKVEGHPFAPLDDDARAKMQADVDAYYDMFVAGVAKGRGLPRATVRGEAFGEGRLLMAQEAVANGLADRVATLDDVLGELASGAWLAPARASAANELTPAVVAELFDVPESSLPTAVELGAIEEARQAEREMVTVVGRRLRALAHEALR